LAELSQPERTGRLEALVLEQAVAVSREQLELGLDEPLMEAGLDSLAATELRSQLSHSLGGVTLSAGMLFDHPTVSRLAAHLESVMFGATVAQGTSSARVAQPVGVNRHHQHLVLSGTSCLLPGTSNTPSELWCLLAQAKDPICSVPVGRWDEHAYTETAPGSGGAKCYVQCGGFVAGMEGFGAAFFRISSSEARQMDPQQRAVLEVRALLGVHT
jgi:aryl carrier-like protein